MKIRCYKCKEIKESLSFHKCKRNKSGFQSACKECRKKQALLSKDKKSIYDKKRYENNFEEIKKRSADNYENNKEKILLYIKEYQQRPKSRFTNYKKSAKERNLKFDLSLEQFVELTAQFCFYCGEHSNLKNYCGLDRIDNNKGYLIENVVSCCEFCNRAKLFHTKEQFIKKVNLISRKHKLK